MPVLATATVPRSTEVHLSLGYWHGGALANPAHVRAGWLEACGSSHKHVCEAPLDNEIADAARIRGDAGEFRVRTIALANVRHVQPMRLVAVHGHDARHEMWSAWRGACGVDCSSPVAMRMASGDGSALALEVIAGEVTRQVALPARQGTYVLSLGASPMRWRGVSLVARDAARPLALELAHRASGAVVTTPYLLMTVERVG